MKSKTHIWHFLILSTPQRIIDFFFFPTAFIRLSYWFKEIGYSEAIRVSSQVDSGFNAIIPDKRGRSLNFNVLIFQIGVIMTLLLDGCEGWMKTGIWPRKLLYLSLQGRKIFKSRFLGIKVDQTENEERGSCFCRCRGSETLRFERAGCSGDLRMLSGRTGQQHGALLRRVTNWPVSGSGFRIHPALARILSFFACKVGLGEEGWR